MHAGKLRSVSVSMGLMYRVGARKGEAMDYDEIEEPIGVKNQKIGRRGEAAAARYLELKGYEIVERNWTCPAGEADIIAYDEGTLVFVEVKTRTNLEKGLPAEAVTPEKRARYEKIAAWFLRSVDVCDTPVRFDVVSLLVACEDRALVRHYVNAYGAGF